MSKEAGEASLFYTEAADPTFSGPSAQSCKSLWRPEPQSQAAAGLMCKCALGHWVRVEIGRLAKDNNLTSNSD